MNKQELIERIEDFPCEASLVTEMIRINKNTLLGWVKELDLPQPIELKDVIAQIKIFDVGTQKVWLNEILNELGSDYGTLKYKAGYEQGKLEGEWVGQQLKDADKIRQELNKPVVPQFVADWIEYFKNCKGNLYGSTSPFSYYGRAILEDFEGDYEEVLRWIRDNSDIYARAWLDGYTVEKEPKYTVKFKATKQYLSNDELGIHFDPSFRSNFTKSDLEKLGLGWVFDCEGMEVEKVGK